MKNNDDVYIMFENLRKIVEDFEQHQKDVSLYISPK